MDENIQEITESKRSAKRVVYSILIFIVLGIAIVAYLYNKFPQQNNNAVTLQKPTTTNTFKVSQPSDITKILETITIEGSDAAGFDPRTIMVKQGQKLKFVFYAINEPHDFILNEYNIKSPVIQVGKSFSVDFVADKIGTFSYYSSVGKVKPGQFVVKP